jgi:hypothetical protein
MTEAEPSTFASLLVLFLLHRLLLQVFAFYSLRHRLNRLAEATAPHLPSLISSERRAGQRAVWMF